MQSVESAFSVEAFSPLRAPRLSTEISWRKDLRDAATIFTIGVSTIGGTDLIGGNAGYAFEWNRYRYFDETEYAMEMGYSRELNLPEGGVVKALAHVNFDNTSGRFTPRHMGGNSELYTAILPRRPLIINAGFYYDGTEHLIPQFVGINTKTPRVDMRSRQMLFEAADFVDFLQNRKVDTTAMYTGLRSDQLIERLLINQGFSTSDYDLDIGVNTLDFALIEVGDSFANAITKIVQAENGHFYQSEEGKLIFQNRNRWGRSPYNTVQRVITTGMVLESYIPDEGRIINVVEVRSSPRAKAASQTIWTLPAPIELAALADTEIFVSFDDPVLSAGAPSYTANSASDGSGTNLTGSIGIKSTDLFATSEKIVFTNSSSKTAYITAMTITGRPALVDYDLYYRAKDDSSVTAYEEQPLTIDNDYIQSEDQAASYAAVILSDFSDPENLQTIRIRAIPELQLGDLVSWQGRYWRIYSIEADFSPNVGFVQTLKLLQKDIESYFQIGVSTIGGTDTIAP